MKIKIYLNGTKPKILSIATELKLWQMSTVKLAVYRVMLEHITAPSTNENFM